MKTRTSILIETEILKTAQELGINVSKACENTLKLYINALTNANSQINPNQANPNKTTSFGEAFLERKGSLVRSPGFEPGIASLEELRVDWDGFREFMRERSRSEYAEYCVSYAKQYYHCLLKEDFSEIQSLPRTIRANILKALANLSKFLGKYPEFKRLKEKYKLEWVGKSSDDIIIDRLTKVEDPNVMFDWMRKVKREIPELTSLIDLMAITGLRLKEAINVYNLIIALNKKGKLNEYYNEEKEVLEHYKFKDTFLRHNKKVFISFVPKPLIQRIAESEPIHSRFSVESKIQKHRMKIRFTDIREAHASFMASYLKPPEIDFLHGRVSANVFMQNYFNPALISDLKERVFKGIKEIQGKIQD